MKRIADSIVLSAIQMLCFHVLDPRIFKIEMAIAWTTIMIILAPHVVALARFEALKVEVAVIAGPVEVGILFVLLQGSVIWKRSLTSITICHQMVVVRREE